MMTLDVARQTRISFTTDMTRSGSASIPLGYMLEGVWDGKVAPKLALDRAAERGDLLLRQFQREHGGAEAPATAKTKAKKK